MKYMIMMFGSEVTMMETRSKEWITEMIEFMRTVGDDLTKSGELAGGHGLVDPGRAKTVSFSGGAPVATDGPFAESKESLAGYWIVDVESETRAIEIASRIVAFDQEPIEVRQIRDRPPEL